VGTKTTTSGIDEGAMVRTGTQKWSMSYPGVLGRGSRERWIQEVLPKKDSGDIIISEIKRLAIAQISGQFLHFAARFGKENQKCTVWIQKSEFAQVM
jgi:hypothetical protein